jgi:conjugative relaxase-like TrwC/TraI family protein
METKVRKGYQQDNRVSPNMVYAKFVHGETRPVDGIPDPHYHIHVFAMNATFDEVEKEWKALEVGNTVGDRTFYEAHFHHLLATKLEACRYGIRRTDHHFELASVSRELVEKFSRRTELIEQRARDKYKIETADIALMKDVLTSSPKQFTSVGTRCESFKPTSFSLLRSKHCFWYLRSWVIRAFGWRFLLTQELLYWSF